MIQVQEIQCTSIDKLIVILRILNALCRFLFILLLLSFLLSVKRFIMCWIVTFFFLFFFFFEKQSYQFNTFVCRLYAIENGAIVLQSDESSIRQSGYGFLPNVLQAGITRNQEAVVAVFGADLDVSGFGELSYDLYKISDDSESK